MTPGRPEIVKLLKFNGVIPGLSSCISSRWHRSTTIGVQLLFGVSSMISYEDIIAALKDYSEHNLAAIYRCEHRGHVQKTEETLKEFASVLMAGSMGIGLAIFTVYPRRGNSHFRRWSMLQQDTSSGNGKDSQ